MTSLSEKVQLLAQVTRIILRNSYNKHDKSDKMMWIITVWHKGSLIFFVRRFALERLGKCVFDERVLALEYTDNC